MDHNDVCLELNEAHKRMEYLEQQLNNKNALLHTYHNELVRRKFSFSSSMSTEKEGDDYFIDVEGMQKCGCQCACAENGDDTCEQVSGGKTLLFSNTDRTVF